MNPLPVLIVAVALSLAGCARNEAVYQCKKEFGPEPYEFANSFGLIGTLAAQSTDEHAIWLKKFRDCLHSKGFQ